MREVLGDTVPESVLTQVALQCAFDPERALETILSDESTGAPPRYAKTHQDAPLPQGANKEGPLPQGANKEGPLPQGANKEGPLPQGVNKEMAAVPRSNQEASAIPPPKKGACLSNSDTVLTPAIRPSADPLNLSCHDTHNLSTSTLNFAAGSARPSATVAEAGSSSSLAQLMSEHDQKSQRAGLPSLSSSPLAALSGLSLGTLALLNSNSAPMATSPPGHLASSLGSLSLGNPKLTAPGANMASPSFGSLSSVLQSSRPMEIGSGGGAKGADPKGSPSLAELIQEHSNSSPTLYRTLPGLHGNSSIPIAHSTTQTPAGPAPTLTRSLSQLQQSPGLLNTHCFPQTKITTTPEPHVLSLSLMASRRQPVSTVPAADPDRQQAEVEPPPVRLGKLSQLASQHHTRRSSDTPPSLSLAALLSPGKSQPRSIQEGGVRDKPRPLLSHTPLSLHPPRGDQSIDLSVLMAQSSHGGALFARRHDKGLSSPSAVAVRSDHHRQRSSVFARPSVFALTLSVRAPSRGKRRRRMMMMKAVGDLRLEVRGGGHPAFLYGTQTQLVKAKEQMPLLPITPFTFDTPSPDDVVRANQKKAFTRE
ncbi:nascent polypeptide-associated complex subunit alpha, muscle-specific form-like isoform X2 [Salvelinus fontinalis]|nr:nascent polypeptide-associated complex subunit alpha, muscle-specific form-like isoform X2 [Salvelinus fontinalis]